MGLNYLKNLRHSFSRIEQSVFERFRLLALTSHVDVLQFDPNSLSYILSTILTKMNT